MALPLENQEVIFECWLYRLQDVDGRRSLRLSSGWKRKYFVLFRDDTTACLHQYDKKPRSFLDTPKAKFLLAPKYTTIKRTQFRGRRHVCDVTIEDRRLVLSAEDERIFHIFAFFLQTQTKLREELEGACYVVRPDNSEDHRRLGARGSMCLLHVSAGGVTLCLQLSKCILAQWPLSCIKFYESNDRGQFRLEMGKMAPTGQGIFDFKTRHGQSNTIYDVLDKYVMEQAGLQQMVTARSSQPTDALEAMMSQQAALQDFTIACSDPQFIYHLKKLSRGIYDNLAEHLGASSALTLLERQPSLESRSSPMGSPQDAASRPPLMRITPKRSASQQEHKVHAATDWSFMSLGRPLKGQPGQRPERPPGGATDTPDMSAHPMDSQYLHTTSPELDLLQHSPDRYLNTRADAPAVSPGVSSSASPVRLGHPSRGPRHPQPGRAFPGHYLLQEHQRGMYLSKSTQDFTEYAKMSEPPSRFHDNDNYRMNDDHSRSPDGAERYVTREEVTSDADGSGAYVMAGDAESPPSGGVWHGGREISHHHPHHHPQQQREEEAGGGGAHPGYAAVARRKKPSLAKTHSSPHLLDDGDPHGVVATQGGGVSIHPHDRDSRAYELMTGTPPSAASSPVKNGPPGARGDGYSTSPSKSKSKAAWDGSVRQKTPRSAARSEVTTTAPEAVPPLRRQHSRSLEDLTQYVRMSGEDAAGPEQYANEVFNMSVEPSAVAPSEIYSYARPEDLEMYPSDNPSPDRPASKVSLRLLNSKPMSRDNRMSRSLTDLLDASEGQGQVMVNGRALPPSGRHARQDQGRRPPPFDFSSSSYRSQGARPRTAGSRSSSRSQGGGTPPPPMVPATTPTPTITSTATRTPQQPPVGMTSPSPSSASVNSQTSLPGIQVTAKTRVFTRKKSSGQIPTGQTPTGLTPVPVSPSPAAPAAEAGEEHPLTAITRKLDSASMRGRRLPSLPADSQFAIQGAEGGLQGTLC